MRGNIRSSTISAGDSARAFFKPSAPSAASDDGKSAGLAQLKGEKVDHVRLILDDQDFTRGQAVHFGEV